MTILFNGRFDRGARLSDYYHIAREPQDTDQPPLASGRPDDYELVKDPAGSGVTVAKLVMPAAAPGRRELRPYAEDFFGGVGPDFGVRWYGCWLYIPEEPEFQLPPASGVDVDSSEAANNKTLIMQLHQWESPGEPSYPAMQLAIDQNGYVILLTSDPTHPTVSRVPNLRVLRNMPLIRNVWEEWVFRFRYSWDTNGELDIYRNRCRIFSVSGVSTGYNDVIGPFMKFGLYAYSLATWDRTRTVYTKGMIIGDENSSHLEITGHEALLSVSARGAV